MKPLLRISALVVMLMVLCFAYETDSVEEDHCGLYMARVGEDEDDDVPLLFTGKKYKAHQRIGEEELVIPIIDANKNEYSSWHDFVWGDYILPQEIRQEAEFSQDIFVSGVGSMAACSSSSAPPNISFNNKAFLNSRVFPHAEKGAVSDYHNFAASASKDLEAGEVLLIDCNDDTQQENDNGDNLAQKMAKSLDWLKANGVCVDDSLSVRQSTITGAGRGAFAKRFVAAGDVIATSPVLHMDRSQTEIVKQEYKETNHKIPLFRDHGIEYTSQVIGQQLMLNYCYGHPDSNVLLLPLAPGVNFINHHHKSPNAVIRWSTKFKGDDDDFRWLFDEMNAMLLLELGAGELFVEFIALNDIQADDEIFIDYGDEYETAWKEHLSEEDEPFRHEIGVPDGFYPDNWMKADPMPLGDFIASPLAPGHMAPILWAESNEVVTPWAFRLGLHSRVREVLLEYCNKMGITDILKHVTTEGNELEPGTETHMDVEGDDWYLQRPDSAWRSNLHWFSPGGAPAHEHYLQALSAAGFDEILDGIGQYLGMDGLVAFHVTFIGVSFSNNGYLHHDVVEVNGKVYNCIIPLILANDTGPELDLQEWRPDLPEEEQTYRVGRYRYEYDVASMMGDGAVHATSAVDYRTTKEMRMAATVYIADVNDENVDSILNHYTQAYPPGDDVELLMSWKGRHWKRGDPSRKLPKPTPEHVLSRPAETATSRKAAVSKPIENVSDESAATFEEL
jgi:hypothetical protein